MKVDKEEVPLIDISPKLKRPLSLWNPIDYLRVFFWFLFFPKAIRFYSEKYKKSIDRYKLIFQAFIVNIIITVGICAILKPLNSQIHWLLNVSEIILILGFYVILGVAVGMVRGVEGCIAIGVVLGIAVGVAVGVVIGGIEDIMPAFVFVYTWIIAGTSGDELIRIEFEEKKGMMRTDARLVYLGFGSGMPNFFALSLVSIMLYGLTLGLPFCIALLNNNIFAGLFFWVAINILYILAPLHLIEYMITVIYLAFFPSWEKANRLPQLGRLVFLPIPGIQKCLENQLTLDWETGVHNANQLLVYSRQFSPVLKAIKHQLDQSSGDILLYRISAITTNICDWNLLVGISQKQNKFFYTPTYDPPIDTCANAANAGFWFWYDKKTDEAEGAFLKVRDLRHGQELYQTALVIHRGIRAGNLQSIASLEKEMNWLNALPDPELRPGTLKTLRILRSVVGEAHTACHSRSVFSRSTAIRGIFMNINCLIDTGASFCPEPEWSLVRDIALSWRVIFSSARDEINEKLLHSPSLNPYEGYSRLPVTDSTFIGRSRVIGQIENYCASSGLAPVIGLYGQLGMGKSSVLRYLAKNKYTDNIYVYLDMQLVGWANHVGQMLLDVAEAIHKSVSQSGFDIGPAPDSTLYSDFNSARRSLNSLLGRIDSFLSGKRRIILAIDEFELIETGIHGSKIDPGLLLYYLRYLNQNYRWLGLIFAGLHTLKEMGGDYWSAFHGHAQYIRIGYLTRDDTLKLITQPHPDFLLKYQDTLIDEIYRLTYGQPYLVQHLCWELVNHWNDRFLQSGKTLPRVLKLDDLEPLLTPDFYQSSGYYFDGVWSNATPHEQTLMRILSECENKLLSRRELMAEAQKTGFPPDPLIMDDALKLLIRHDIITGDDNGYHFSSELMRRWVTTAPNLQ